MWNFLPYKKPRLSFFYLIFHLIMKIHAVSGKLKKTTINPQHMKQFIVIFTMAIVFACSGHNGKEDNVAVVDLNDRPRSKSTANHASSWLTRVVAAH